LNSAWSQLEQAKDEGHLEFAADQIHSVVNEEITKWTAANNINILVTHHPVSWLTPEAKEEFNNEVNPLGRFDAHLYGHMHEHRAIGQEYSQKSRKMDLQVSSLFGLEKAKDGKIDRAHGYYFAKVEIENDVLKIWPRKAELVTGGGRRIHEDRFSLPDGGDFTTHTLKARVLSDFAQKKKVTEGTLDTLSDALALHSTKHLPILAGLRHSLPVFKNFMSIGAGKYSIDSAVSLLNSDRICWVVSSWDMAGDDFLSCIDNELTKEKRTWYKLSTINYVGHDSFVKSLDRDYGFSIIDLCNILTYKDDAILLLDDVPCTVLSSGKTGLEELINLSKTILEYCPKLKIIVRTTSNVDSSELSPIVLKTMDEADFNQYILTHPDGNIVASSGVRPEELFRLTKGEPATIKKTLRKLRISRLQDINFEESETALTTARASIDDAPDSLKLIIASLKHPVQDRSFNLLQCLTVFPYGEDINNIRNFDPDLPFFPATAEKLLEYGLVDTLQQTAFYNEQDALPKIVVAKRSVQEHIWGILSKDEIAIATGKAICLYFGRECMLGKFRLNPEFKLDKSNHSSASIQNAAILLRRVVNDTLNAGDARAIQNCLALLNYYVSKLDNNCQYRYVCDTCYNLISKLTSLGYSPVIQDIIHKYARSLRMMGDRASAIQLFDDILKSEPIEKNFKARVLIDLAMCHAEMSNDGDALIAAKKVLAMKERLSPYFHAKTIVISLSNEPSRLTKLRALEKRCRNKKHFVAANNIAVQIVAEFENENGKKELYKGIAARAKSDNDTYNFIRSTISHARISINQGDSLPKQEIYNLVLCYHYVCSQRMNSLFNQAHDCLWREFERLGEVSSLVTLFNHSSLLFRLSADEAREKRYLSNLINNKSLPLQSTLASVSETDRIYMISRMVRLGLATIKEASPASLFKLLAVD
jgi:hypothetical protein